MKKSALAAGLKAAAEKRTPPPAAQPRAENLPTVLIGAHFQPVVRSALLLVQAEPKNAGKSLKHLLGEAINDLCAKYGKPQPYSGDA